jgi:hypothetical protein
MLGGLAKTNIWVAKPGGSESLFYPFSSTCSGAWLKANLRVCRMDLPGPTTSVGTRTDYSVGRWDYSACATWHLMAWSTRTTKE